MAKAKHRNSSFTGDQRFLRQSVFDPIYITAVNHDAPTLKHLCSRNTLHTNVMNQSLSQQVWLRVAMSVDSRDLDFANVNRLRRAIKTRYDLPRQAKCVITSPLDQTRIWTLHRDDYDDLISFNSKITTDNQDAYYRVYHFLFKTKSDTLGSRHLDCPFFCNKSGQCYIISSRLATTSDSQQDAISVSLSVSFF